METCRSDETGRRREGRKWSKSKILANPAETIYDI